MSTKTLRGAILHGGLFLLVALAVDGMPLDGELIKNAGLDAIEGRQAVLQEIGSLGSGGSGLSKFFWAGMYAAAFAYLLFNKPQSTLRLLFENKPLVLLILLMPLSALWSDNPKIVFALSAHTIGMLAICVAAIIAYRADPAALARMMAVVLGINVAIHVAGVLLAPEYTINAHGRWRGWTSHPNRLGGIALCALALNVGCLAAKHVWKRWAHITFVAICVAVLIGSQSQTSVVCAMFAGVGPFFLGRTYRRLGRRGAGQMALLSGLVAAALAIPAILFAHEILEAVTGALGRDISFTGRTTIWARAVDAFGARPILGWSFDGHLEVFSKTPLRYTDYHNGYLDIAVSGGLLAISLFAAMIIRYLTQIRNADVGTIIMFLPLTISILIYNILEADLLSGRNTIWTMLVVIVLLQSVARHEQRQPSTNSRAERGSVQQSKLRQPLNR
jgi:exopolysaccharide production protein ExoQ